MGTVEGREEPTLWVRGGAGSEAWELGTPGVTPVSSPREQGEGGAAARQVTGRKGGRTWEKPVLGIWMFSVGFWPGHQCDTPGNFGKTTLRMKSGADLAAERIVKLGGAQDLQPKKGSGQLTLGRVWGAGAAEGGGSQGTIIRGGDTDGRSC